MSVPTVSTAWLRGPSSDLLLGCGLGYMLVFVLLVLAGPQVESILTVGVIPLVLLFLSTPHYGATLLRVYEKRENRVKYQFFTVYLTALIWLVFLGGVYNVMAGSFLLTLYMTWTPWHYAGQNYGISLMFLGRRGVQVPLLAKRLLYASFICSFLLTFLELHANLYQLGLPGQIDGVHYQVQALGIPFAAANVLIWVIGLAYAGSLVVAAAMLLRVASARILVPTALLVLSQSLWFVIPMFMYHFHLLQDVYPLALPNSTYVFFWIAIAHAVQYLWITSTFAQRGENQAPPQFLFKCLLAGALIWIVPGLLFAPSVLGRLTFDQGLAALIAAAVNVHHFMLDGAIWKLRDGPIARVLLRSTAGIAATVAGGGGRFAGAVRAGFVAAGLACIGVSYFSTVEDLRFARAVKAGDRPAMQAVIDRLEWIGRDSALKREKLGQMALDAGDIAGAEAQFGKAVELDASVRRLSSLAQAQYENGSLATAEQTMLRAIRYAQDTGQEPQVQRLRASLDELRAVMPH